ncbi:hypothetical protein D3C76_775130 [compost metagenome]
MLDALVQVDAVIHPHPNPQRHHRQGRDLEANAQPRHQRVAQDRDDAQRHHDAQHRAQRTKGQQAEQANRTEQRCQHPHLSLLDRLVGRRHHPHIAARQVERRLRHLHIGDDASGLADHVGHGRALVVIEEHQHLHALATLGNQARVWRIGHRALLQATRGARYGRPAWVAFVVAGDHFLAHASHALHRLHPGDVAHLEVERLDCAHYRRGQAGFIKAAGLDEYRQHIETDGVAADDALVILVVARIGTQLRRPGADVAHRQLPRLEHAHAQQHQADAEHQQRRPWLRQCRQAPPKGVLPGGRLWRRSHLDLEV